MTRYRFQAVTAEPAPQGRCSRCEEEFPIVALRPSYRLSRPRSVTPPLPGRMTIGMDDPSLAPQLAETGLDADRTVPMLPWSGEQQHPGDLASPPVVTGENHTAFPEEPATDEAVSDEPGDQVEAPSVSSRNPAREWRVTLLFGTAGAAAGYYASTVWNLDMWQATAGMAGGWLLLAWIWVRWVARRH